MYWYNVFPYLRQRQISVDGLLQFRPAKTFLDNNALHTAAVVSDCSVGISLTAVRQGARRPSTENIRPGAVHVCVSASRVMSMYGARGRSIGRGSFTANERGVSSWFSGQAQGGQSNVGSTQC